MTVAPNSWAVQQKTKFAARRRFMRDVLLNGIGFRFVVKLNVHHLERVPKEGATLLMINHVTAIDPIIVAGLIRHRFVNVMSKIENFYHPIAAILVRNWGCYPVRRGEIDREALKNTLDLLELGELVLIAPEGTRQPQLIKAKDGIAYLALKSDPIIVPVVVYNAETWLRDFFIRRTPIQVAFGQPFKLKKDERKRVPREELAHITDEMMYQMAALLPEQYRGAYADLRQMTTDYLKFI